ncbi:MAG: ester cyclase [Chloroflexi bacterium]|nr:ester cyclase [Chloroflexota bacterium]
MFKRISFSVLIGVLVAILIIGIVPVIAQDDGPVTPATDEYDTEIEARNKALTYQLYEETNAGNGQFFVDLLAEDYVDHNFEGGRDAFLALYETFFTAFPDLQFEVTHVVADGDFVTVRGVQHGTNSGDFMGIPATNKEVSWTGTAIFRFNEEGKVVERWQDLDQLGLMTQLGAIPGMGGATSGG